MKVFQYFSELVKQSKGQSLGIVIWALFFGILLACLLALYEKRVIGSYVRALLSKGAKSPEKALTLAETGFRKNAFVRSALRRKTALSSLVFTPEEAPEIGENLTVQPVIRGKVDFDTARFYIPEALEHRAYVRYDRKGTHVMGLVAAAILFGLLAWAIVIYLPTLLGYLLIGYLKQLFGLA